MGRAYRIGSYGLLCTAGPLLLHAMRFRDDGVVVASRVREKNQALPFGIDALSCW